MRKAANPTNDCAREHQYREALRRAFAKFLRHLRENHHIAQEKLAYKAGLDRSHLGELERAQRTPNLETIYRVLSCVEMTFEDFGREFDECLRKELRAERRSKRKPPSD